MEIKTINALLEQAKKIEKQKIVVVAAQEHSALTAVMDACEFGIVDPILIGCEDSIKKIADEEKIDLSGVTIIDEKNVNKCAVKAVEMVKNGEADILMKGLISTAPLLKVVLNKETGLNTGKLASHVSVFEVDSYHKLIIVTDAAINIDPDLKTKIDIINNAVTVSKALGVDTPKVAVLAAVEKVNPGKMPCTEDAAILTQMNRRGQLPGCIIDGPLAFDNAVSKESAKIKKIESDVAGEADILLANDIEAGNVLYKAIIYFAKGKGAGLVMGAARPIVLTSRADDKDTKLASIALGALTSTLMK